jgi:hypothetical protein
LSPHWQFLRFSGLISSSGLVIRLVSSNNFILYCKTGRFHYIKIAVWHNIFLFLLLFLASTTCYIACKKAPEDGLTDRNM